jgi:hypothetical protein
MSQFWINDPTILLNKYNLFFWPTDSMSMNDKLNAITRLVVALTIAGFLFTQNINFVWIGILTLGSIIVYHTMNTVTKEPFEKQNPKHHTSPTSANPLMNVLLPEINGNPNRKSAMKSYTPDTEQTINKKVKQQKSMLTDTYKGTNNEIKFENSMRNFYTTANTTIPNDQEGFSNFLYGNMISGKEGNTTALAGRNSGLYQLN